MAQINIYRDGVLMLQAEAQKLSILGFDCEIPLNQIADLRDESGRIQTFEFDLLLSKASEPSVIGQISIYSVRRVAQTSGMLTARFMALTTDNERCLAEYLQTGKIVNIKTAQQKRRA